LIHENPIIKLEDFEEKVHPDWVAIFPSLKPLTEINPNTHLAVHPTTLSEYCRVVHGLRIDRRKYIDKLYAECEQGIEHRRGTSEYVRLMEDAINERHEKFGLRTLKLEQGKTPYMPYMEEPIYQSCNQLYGLALFSVDMYLPDKIIEEHFKRSLRTARIHLSGMVPSSRKMPPDFLRKWIDNELLAYMDLLLEKHLTGGSILSYADIAQLLWPSDGSSVGSTAPWGEEHVVNTTDAIAKEIWEFNSIDFNVLSAMAAEKINDACEAAKPIQDLRPLYKRVKTRRNRSRRNK